MLLGRLMVQYYLAIYNFVMSCLRYVIVTLCFYTHIVKHSVEYKHVSDVSMK
jgi:hypothetical protein